MGMGIRMVYFAFVCLIYCSIGVLSLVPIPLEPQRACFTHFGECIRYCPRERVPDLVGTESSCITDAGGYQYCKFYHCPPKPCRTQLRKKDLYGKCYYCPGYCIDGNKMHQNGEGFLSIDMVNTCFCGQDNYKHCEKKPVDQFSFCNHARPNDVGYNTKVVVVEKPQPPPETNIVVVEKPAPPPPPPEPPVAVAVATAYVKPPSTPPPKQPVYMPPPTQPPYQTAYVKPPPTQPPYAPYPTTYPNNPQTQPHQPQSIAYPNYPPTQPPHPQQLAYHETYVQNPPTHPPASHTAVYVSAPQPPTPPHFGFLPPPGNHPQHVAHPDFSAKSPKSNLQQRFHSNPHLTGHNAQFSPMQYRNNQPFSRYPFNPFIGPFPWNRSQKQEIEA